MAGSAWSNQVQNQVIVGGANGRVLVYSGTPGVGNLIASVAGSAGTDAYGNNYVSGDASYAATFATALNGGQVTWYSGSLAAGWTSLATATSHAVSPSGLVITGNAEVLVSNSAGNAAIFLGNLAGPNVVAFTGNVIGLFTGVPGSANVQETWHSMTLLNSWANVAGFAVAEYRAVAAPVNGIEIVGAINAAAATSATFFTLPAGYRPSSKQPVCAMGASGSVPANLAPWVQVDTSGNLSVQNTGAVPAAWQGFFHGLFALDA